MQQSEFASAIRNVKLPGFAWPEPDDAGDLRIIKNVVDVGCHIIAVEKTVGHAQFAYSIGLYLNYLQPEVVIVGMDHLEAGRAINRIAARFRRGEALAAGPAFEGLHETKPLRFQELTMQRHSEELGFAIWFYCSRSSGLRFPVYQAIWPDQLGRFPDDPNCNKKAVEAQVLR